MIFNWFLVFNLTEFLATQLVSKTYQLELEGIGIKDILATNGKTISVTYEAVMLSINLNGKNPFIFEGHAVFLDNATQNVYLGLPT